MTLTYSTSVRRETDPAIIGNLKRKGWVENEPPAFNPATHRQPEWSGTAWVSVAFDQAELNTNAAQTAASQERIAVKALLAKLADPGGDTAAQRLARLERCIARIIRDSIQ